MLIKRIRLSSLYLSQSIVFRWLLRSCNSLQTWGSTYISYEFGERTVTAPMAPGKHGEVTAAQVWRHFVSANDQFFRYLDENFPATSFFPNPSGPLDAFVAEAGPFDGVMAFSKGVGLAASLLIYKLRQSSRQQRVFPALQMCRLLLGWNPNRTTDRLEHA